MIERVSQSLGVNRVVLALSFARLGDAVGNSILFIIIPLYVARLPAPVFGLPRSARVGIALALYGLVAALGQPVVGAISDRLGRRKPLILAGLVAMALFTLAFTVVGRFTDLLLLRGLQGLAVALTIPTSLAIMSSATEKRTRGGAMGVYSTMRIIGLATGPLLAGLLYDHVGFNAAFYAGGGFVALGALLVYLWVDEVPGDTRAARERPFRVFEAGVLSRGILGLGFATFAMAVAFSMMGALETEFNQRLDQTALAFGLAFSALMLSRLVLQIPVGRWSDRVGRKPFLVVGLVLMAPATALLGYAATTGQLVLLRVAQGIASAGIAAPAFALAADLANRGGEGRQMSIITTGFGLGLALGPLLAGVLAIGDFALPFVMGGALALVGALVVLRYVPESVRPRARRATAR